MILLLIPISCYSIIWFPYNFGWWCTFIGRFVILDVSAILPTYYECENIGDLIDALASSLRSFGWQSEVVVVDDNSLDCTAASVVNHPLPENTKVKCLLRL